MTDKILLSECKNAFSSVTETDLASVCERIKTGSKCAAEILAMRHLNSAKRYDERKAVKRTLPAFTGGLYDEYNPNDKNNLHNRNANYYKSSRVIILDVDHISDINLLPETGDETDIARYKADIVGMEDDWLYNNCYAVFTSPSGDGLKLVFAVDKPIYSSKHYKQCWRYIADRYEEQFPEHLVDKSTSDHTRLCFYSYDPKIIIFKNVINLNFLTSQIGNYDSIDPEIETDTGRKVTAKAATKNEQQLLLLLAKHIKTPHYKVFRDACSAASNLGTKFLSEFYDVLYRENIKNMSDESQRALKNKSNYMRSFSSEHNRVPLQYLTKMLSIQDEYTPDMFKGIVEKSGLTIKQKTGKPLLDYKDVYDSIVDYMNVRYANFKKGSTIISIPMPGQREFFDMSNGGATATSDKNTIGMTKRTDFKAHMMNRTLTYMDTKGEWCSKEYFDIWWKSRKRRDCDYIVCSPGRVTAANEINTWTGFNIDETKVKLVVEKEKLTGELICDPILKFFFEIICNKNKSHYKFLTCWLAEMIQNPTATNKPGVALVIRSIEKGTGKGTFSAFIQDIIGPIHSVQVNDTDSVVGRFNYMLDSKLFVALDEAVFAGDKRSSQKLKSIISEPTMVIEKKGIDSYKADCLARILIMSNASHTLNVERDNRRIFVLTLAPEKIDQWEYFRGLRQCMANGGKESLFNYLKNVKFTAEDLQVRKYKNEHTDSQARQSMDNFDLWLVSVLQRQFIWDEIGKRQKLNAESGTFVSIPNLFNDFKKYMDDNKERYQDNLFEFWTRMEKTMNTMVERKGVDVYNSKVTEIEIPGLNEIAELEHGRYAPPRWTPLKDITFEDKEGDYLL